MKITKILNNNLVLCSTNLGEDIIVSGLGIGFEKKKNQNIDDDKVEKVFYTIGKHDINKLMNMVGDIPGEYFLCADKILSVVQDQLTEKIPTSLYISLTDHIFFLKKRIEENHYFPNQFGWEIQRYYPDEYNVALSSIKIIEEYFNILIPDEEACNLAMHFMTIKGTYTSIEEKTQEIKIIQDVLNIVKYESKNKISQHSLDYERFIVHLKFFVKRIMIEDTKEEVNFLYDYVKSIMVDSFNISEKIGLYINKSYGKSVSKSQLAYLTVHIQRLREEGEKNE